MQDQDLQDPYNAPYDGGTVSTGTMPPSTDAFYQQVYNWYQQYLGRTPTVDEVNSHRGNPGGLSAVETLIKGSPEAAAYTASHVPTPPTPHDPGATPTPTPTTPTTTTGGALPGPAPIPTTTAAPPPAGSTTYTPPPAYVPPPAFSYQDFNAPTGDDVLNDPGYQFELGQGIQAIGAKNAALGTLNTGGTIKDFMGYGQNLASTKYNDLFNRDLTQYQTNRGNALDTYNTNYGTQYKDPYAINYASQYTDPFSMNLQGAQLGQQNNQFNAQLGQNNSQFNSNMDWAKFLQNYKATVTDPFAQKYSLLGLL